MRTSQNTRAQPDKELILMRAVYDCIRFVAGGVIGAVVALYFTRMILPLNAEAFALSMGFFLPLYVVLLFMCHWVMDQKEAELRENQRFLDSLSDETGT